MTVIVQRGSWPGWATGSADIPLSDEAAPYYLTMLAAYRAETGRIDGEIAEPVGGDRTPDQVRGMQAAFDSRNPSQMAFWNLDPSSKARPGLSSPHIGGNCADIWAAGFQWFIDNSPRFGWRRTLVGSGDIHHFQFFSGTATAALDQEALDNGVQKQPNRSIPDMSLTRDTDNNNALLLVPSFPPRWFRRSLMGDVEFDNQTGRYSLAGLESPHRMEGGDLDALAADWSELYASTNVTLDEKAITAALAKVLSTALPGLSEADLDAATAKIIAAIPTSFTITKG